jgi:hypothetical protein
LATAKIIIAAGCAGKGKDGSWTFNEFIKYINDLNEVPSITDDLNPDVEITAKALDDTGLTGKYDILKIYPKGGVAGTRTLFQKVGELMSASKTALEGGLSSI